MHCVYVRNGDEHGGVPHGDSMENYTSWPKL